MFEMSLRAYGQVNSFTVAKRSDWNTAIRIQEDTGSYDLECFGECPPVGCYSGRAISNRFAMK